MAYTPVSINKDSNRSTALKLYTGEVLKAFAVKNIALGTVNTRTISGGKSYQFIVTGKGSDSNVAAHVPGTDITTQVLANDEVTITVDTRYYYSHFVDALDEKLAQYEIRGELARQAGEALSTKIDKAIFQGIADMFATANWTPKPGQSAAYTVSADLSAASTNEAKGNALVAAYFDIRKVLNQRDVTAEPTVVTTPENYYYLVQSTRGVNQDYTNGNGGIDSGMISKVAGLSTTWSNHLPATFTVGTTAGVELHALVYTKDVFGVVKAMDITSESNYIPEKLGDLLTSYYALGMGGLNATGLGAIIEG